MKDPRNAPAFHGLAAACERLGQPQESEGYRRRFAELSRKEPAPGTTIRDRVNDIDLARGNLAETHLAAAKTCLGPARTSRTMDRPAEAERHLRAAARADRKNRAARLTLLQLYDRQKRFREAAEVLAELEEIDPNDEVHRINRGILLVRLGEFDAAEKEFRQATALAPEEPDGHAKLAQLFLKRGTRLEEARACAASAMRLRPKEAARHLLFAEICRRQGDRAAAQAALKRAAELDPGDPQVQQAKAMWDAEPSK